MSGDTLEITYTHSTAGNRTFEVEKDQDIECDLGGYTSETKSTGKLGGHEMKTARGWTLAPLNHEYSVANRDQEYLQAIADSPVKATITWEHIDGYVYKMKGCPQGEIKGNSKSGFISINLGGPGKMEIIA